MRCTWKSLLLSACQYCKDLKRAACRPVPVSASTYCEEVCVVLFRPVCRSCSRPFSHLDHFYERGPCRRRAYKCCLFIPCLVLLCLGVALCYGVLVPRVCTSLAVDARRDTAHNCNDQKHRNGQLILLDCTIPEAELPLVHGWGPFENMSVQAIGLRAQVEMFQCIERGAEEFSDTGILYTFGWSRHSLSSSNFERPDEAMRTCGDVAWKNPAWPDDVPHSGAHFADSFRLGSFTSDMPAQGRDEKILRIPVTGWSPPPGWTEDVLLHWSPQPEFYNFEYYSATRYEDRQRRYDVRRRRNFVPRASSAPPFPSSVLKVGFHAGTFYNQRAQVDSQSPIGIMRIRFFKNSDMTEDEDGTQTGGLRVMRIGRNDNGNIVTWKPPLLCGRAFTQNRMLYYRSQQLCAIDNHRRRRYVDNPYETRCSSYNGWRWGAECAMDEYRSSYQDCTFGIYRGYFREGGMDYDEAARFQWIIFFFLMSSCCLSCKLGVPRASAEARPPVCHGCFCCCACFSTAAQLLLVPALLHLAIVGLRLLGVGMLALGLLFVSIAMCLCKTADPEDFESPCSWEQWEQWEEQGSVEAVPLGKPVDLSDLD
mmetsp:Transcript_45393/g.105317  ORF Transcript_45393/g.105317 Transcript_45393/m.105317 type:complete len:593 (-) Transcript_45393:171-1949(-)